MSCSDPYEVRIRFSNASLRSAATRVEVALVESCEGLVSGPAVGVVRQVEFGIEEPIGIGPVDAGEYGLYVRATSVDCTVIATGCSQVSIDNSGGVLEVLVQPAAGQACITGFSCRLGQCIPGSRDAGSGIDGGPDAEVDSGICTLPVPSEINVDPPSGQIALDSFGCMVRGGRLFCFGPANDSGQLSGSAEACEGGDGCLEEVAHPGGGSWSQVSTGSTHACAFDEDGRLFCWGSSEFGALGRATGREGVAEAASFGVSRVSCGGSFTCAIKSNTRTLHCWGNDASGQTGVLTEGSCAGGGGMVVSLPTRTSPPEEEACPPLASSPEVELWSDITTSADTGCSLLQDGRGYCWGGVANGTTGNEVACFPGCRATSIGRWRRLSENVLHHRCGIRDDGELLCWGSNGRGQLGIGSVTEDSTPDVGVCDPAPGDRGNEVLLSETTPVAHPSGANWTDVSAGFFHTCALDSEGAVYCWGENDQNAVAEGAEFITTSPVRVPLPDGVRATEVLAGNRLSCARSEDEGLYCWGASNIRCAGVANCPAIHRIPFLE
ncbi:MAG: RCC1 domain-containing protein [Polyangiales bacterium]